MVEARIENGGWKIAHWGGCCLILDAALIADSLPRGIILVYANRCAARDGGHLVLPLSVGRGERRARGVEIADFLPRRGLASGPFQCDAL
jgi:hypothetical protein